MFVSANYWMWEGGGEGGAFFDHFMHTLVFILV